MHETTLDWLSGAEALDMDLTGSGKKKKKHKSVRAKKRWAAIHAARARQAAAQQMQPDAFDAAMQAEQGEAAPLPFFAGGGAAPMQQDYEPLPRRPLPGVIGYDEGGGFEAIGAAFGGDEGGGQGGARMLDVASFDDDGPRMPMRAAPTEYEVEEEELDFEVEGGAGLPFFAAINGSGCGCETYRRYPRRDSLGGMMRRNP